MTTRRKQTISAQPFALEPLEERLLMAAAPITFVDGDGTSVKIALAGNGAIDLVGDVLNVTGTDQGSRLTITSSVGGDGRTVLADINVSGAIKSIIGNNLDLLGDVSVSGSIGQLTLRDLLAGGQHVINIGGSSAAAAANLTLRRVTDLTVNSGTPIRNLKVTDWDDTDDDDLITAPKLSRAESKEDFAAGARIEDPQTNKASLGQVVVKNALSGVWYVDGPATSVSTGSATAGFRMNVLGKLNSLTTKGDFGGVVAAVHIGKISIGGNLINALLLGGADLGDDAQLGGTGGDADLFFRGIVGGVTVKGQVINSIIAAGLDPANGVFGDGDDFVTGKKRSTFGATSIRGIADADSIFAAGKFTGRVSVGGTCVDPPGDPRFILASTAADEDPPVIVADLRTDTGTDGDNITSDPTITGRVTDLGQVVLFRMGIDDEPLPDFVNILSLVEPDGTFEIPRAKIEQINKGPLTPGLHTINLLARDEIGNTAAIFTVTFFFAP